MQFSENNFQWLPLSKSIFLKKQDVKYTLAVLQIRYCLSYNLVKDHVSLDFGCLQVNGKLKLIPRFENNIISGTTLTAKRYIDITLTVIFTLEFLLE